MKPKGRMATMRSDIERNRKMIHCENASWIGFSRSDLRYGDFFLTNENRLGRCHGQVRASFMSKGPIKSWHILAQMASPTMAWTGERWIKPEDVIETIPSERMDENIVAFFDKHLTEEI